METTQFVFCTVTLSDSVVETAVEKEFHGVVHSVKLFCLHKRVFFFAQVY
jgi:hypothetical protein